MNPPLARLRARLPELMVTDAHRLARRLDGARRLADPDRVADLAARIAAEVDAAQARVDARRAGVPAVSYPPELPVSGRREDILAAIRDHQVVVVAGETGSGKTTQLPKMCLELGRGVRGRIGHTQPRRLAARAVADRIAAELGTPLGGAVGYQVRFTDRAGPDTLVKVMTDGILLAELSQDRLLRRYDTLIIDEAHERSLNIDFILGYLKQLLPRRPDLKVVITSATIDPQRFARHYPGPDGRPAPIVEVSGRTYPVQVRYRPLTPPAADDPDAGGEAEPRDQIEAIRAAVAELRAEGPGDILVFLSGEREIRDTADALRRADLPDTEVLPLYARLSSAEQHRIFQPHPGRRIVLATNVAETSLTVPGIRYVIDPGTARISRYSHRLKVQRLPIEPVSQASADQRKGRCGRVADGICIRLYDEADFAARPQFTDPEILRTNLASVILQMAALGLGDVAGFPFLEPPDRRQVTDGVRLLEELGALEPGGSGAPRLTPLGRRLAQLPVDPRLGRMVLEAERNGCVAEVIVIAAALSIQDPRERPTERRAAADAQHARFVDPESDFLALLNLWNHLRERQRELSSSGFRRMCQAEFLNYLRVREWQDVVSQLRQVVRDLGVTVNSVPAAPPAIHVSLLAGLLSHLGLKDVEKQDYLGARGARWAIFPGSALFRKRPQWVMAAELVETSRLWGRVCARIDPEWVEPLAGHLVKRSYSEPRWSRRQAAVLATEKVTLYGLPVVAARRVNYGRIDPQLSRELFIRHALVEGDWDTRHEFFHANRALLDEVAELEHRARRRDILVDDETLFEFYAARIPADVVSGQHFDAWWKKERRSRPDLLSFTTEMLVNAGRGGVAEADYPEAWQQGDLTLPLSYQFEPGAATDGVTVHVPVAALPAVDPADFAWQVPGLRLELVTALLRTLPKATRRNFVPAPDYAAAALHALTPRKEPLLDGLERALRALTGVVVPRAEWGLDRVPDHLRVTFRVVDAEGGTLAEGKDLAALRERLAPKVRETLAEPADGLARSGLTGWDFDALPRTVRRRRGAIEVTGYPTLVDEGESVAIRVVETPHAQRVHLWQGVRRLLWLGVPPPLKSLQARLGNAERLALSRNPHGGVPALLADCVTATLDALIGEHGGPPWDAAGFAALRDAVRAALPGRLYQVVTEVQRILAAAHGVEQRLGGTRNPLLLPALTDIRAQLAGLVYPGFVATTGAARLPDLPRYLRAVEARLDRLPANPRRDGELMAAVHAVQREYRQLFDRLGGGGPRAGELARIRWMIEELRVSYFAQGQGTAYPVSDVRIYRAMDDLEP
ncbi:MAG TPA: ATP-dependent RNA helicase HrpA [Pilimelia sp.]|nr:ATP-dependent RNA helicase HrpA [Pilimelia sp.]